MIIKKREEGSLRFYRTGQKGLDRWLRQKPTMTTIKAPLGTKKVALSE
jgi:hypothetical protein